MIYTFFITQDMPETYKTTVDLLSAQIRAREKHSRIYIRKVKGTVTWDEVTRGNIEYARRVARRNGYKCCI